MTTAAHDKFPKLRHVYCLLMHLPHPQFDELVETDKLMYVDVWETIMCVALHNKLQWGWVYSYIFDEEIQKEEKPKNVLNDLYAELARYVKLIMAADAMPPSDPAAREENKKTIQVLRVKMEEVKEQIRLIKQEGKFPDGK